MKKVTKPRKLSQKKVMSVKKEDSELNESADTKQPITAPKKKPSLAKLFLSIVKMVILKVFLFLKKIVGTLKKLKKRDKIIILALVLIISFGAIFFLFYPLETKEKTLEEKKADEKKELFSSIKKADLVGEYSVDQKAIMEDLEITIYNTKEGSYRTFDRDENDQRISKEYFAIHAKVFNTSNITNDIISIALQDSDGNQYMVDYSISFFLGDMKDFGPDKNVYHRTIREGYLIYPAPPKDVEKLELIFYSEVTNKKAIFELER